MRHRRQTSGSIGATWRRADGLNLLALRLLGDRLQKPGKEAVTFNGTLDEFIGGRKASTSQITLVEQYPSFMRMDYTGAHQSVIFNGNQGGKQGGNVTQQD